MTELFEKLGVDWKLLIAQIINFAILFWILKRYAYKPILGALDKRSKAIAKSLDDAKHVEEQVKQLHLEKTKVMRQARTEASDIVEQARKDAEAFTASARSKTQAQTAEMMAAAKREVTQMKHDVVAEAQADLAGLVIKATEKVIHMKVEGAQDRKMVEDLLRKAKS